MVAALADLYPAGAHVRDFALERADDSWVWDFARQGGYIIVSKDEDFHQRSFLYGAPPKVVWLDIGNCSTRQVEHVLRHNAPVLHAFSLDDEAAFLILP